jgi:putative ABC transport system ATP-binding protein
MVHADPPEVCFELDHVKKTYGKPARPGLPPLRPALHISHLRVLRGQTTAILGYSGSGKSTLLNILSLLDLPDESSGDIVYCGRSYRSIRRNTSLQNRIRQTSFGFVFQDNHLLEHLSSARNVGLGLAIKGLPLWECDVAAMELLDDVGIGAKARSLPQELSGGEKQRVAVMRAIAHDPQVVFADEPTGNLDWDTGLTVMKRLALWQEGRGHTLIVVSHNIHQVFDFADRFLMLKDGEIIFQGFHTGRAASAAPGEQPVSGPEALTEVLRVHSSVPKR